jgi:acyl carrier protein
VTLRQQLVELIRSWDLDLDGDVGDDTTLITSGVFDSQALFNLALWVEEQIGSPVDPASFDMVEEWNTIAGVVHYVERRQRSRPAAADAITPGHGRTA